MAGHPAHDRPPSRHPERCIHDDEFVRLERLAARRPAWLAPQVVRWAGICTSATAAAHTRSPKPSRRCSPLHRRQRPPHGRAPRPRACRGGLAGPRALLARAKSAFESLADGIGVGDCLSLQVQNGRTRGRGVPARRSRGNSGVFEALAAHVGSLSMHGYTCAQAIRAMGGAWPTGPSSR